MLSQPPPQDSTSPQENISSYPLQGSSSPHTPTWPTSPNPPEEGSSPSLVGNRSAAVELQEDNSSIPAGNDSARASQSLTNTKPQHTAESSENPSSNLSEKLSEGFQQVSKAKAFFKVGRIFKALWSEPAAPGYHDPSRDLSPIMFGELAFSEIRRFVVIREGKTCCICIPIHTYRKQGTLKRGVTAEDHAAIYDHCDTPSYLPNEARLNKAPFAYVPVDSAAKLHPTSRLNFGKVYTIEHNIKVQNIGKIIQEHLPRLKRYFIESMTNAKDEENSQLIWPPPSPFDHLRAIPGHSEGPLIPAQGFHGRLDPTNQFKSRQDDFELTHSMAKLDTQDVCSSTFSEPNRNTLDAGYQVRREESFFTTGRVFACLWSEPATKAGNVNTQDVRISSVFLDGIVYTNIQRFVIIVPRLEQHFSICCPIKTYGRQGTDKFTDPKAHYQHCIIYTDERAPTRLRSEREYDKEPICMIPADLSVALDLKSRINFGRPTPVEHTLRMKNLGQISSADLKRLLLYFDEVNSTGYANALHRSSVDHDLSSRYSAIDSNPEQDSIERTGSRRSAYASYPHHFEVARGTPEQDLIDNRSRGRISADHDLSSRYSAIDSNPEQGLIDRTGSRRSAYASYPHHFEVARRTPEQDSIDNRSRGRISAYDISPAGEDLIHSTSRRRSLTYRSRHSTTETIHEQEQDDHDDGVVGSAEGEGNAGRSRRMGRRESHASHGYLG